MNFFSIFGDKDRHEEAATTIVAPSSPSRRIASGGVVTTTPSPAGGRDRAQRQRTISFKQDDEDDDSSPSSSVNSQDRENRQRHQYNMGLPLSIRLLKHMPYCPHCTTTSGVSSSSSRRQQEQLYEQVQQDLLASTLACQVIAPDVVDHHDDPTISNASPTVVATTVTTTNAPAPSSATRSTTRSQPRHRPSTPTATPFVEYDLPSLSRHNRTRASPFVVAPMMLHHPSSSDHPSLSQQAMILQMQEQLVADYLACCQFYGGRHPNAGVLTTLRFSLPSLRVVGSFHDADMLALAELLLKYANGPLRYISRLDFGMTAHHRRGVVGEFQHHRHAIGFRSHGALCLSKVLQQTRHVREIIVSRNRIGAYGASALFLACSQNPTIHALKLRRCRVGERGALAFCDICVLSPDCGLQDVDLSANYIGFRGIVAIETAMKNRSDRLHSTNDLAVNLEGNLVLQEVMNGVTHGLGVLLAFVASYLLSQRVKDAPSHHRVSCMVYSTSLIVLYISSTLFHSFFTMLHTRYIFSVIDKCAIYILIAGSYTPALQVALWHEPLYSKYLLGFIWVCCFLGIYVEAFLPGWKLKGRFSLAMYLGMGWSALVCLPDFARIVPESAMNLMVLGGVAYTAGVPFFVRDNNLDHAVWHLFVLGGSIFHWCAIYFHVATLP